MGSAQLLPGAAPQQEELPPDFTRRAASPYFCFTTALMSAVSAVLMSDSLFADLNHTFLNNALRFERLVASAAFGVEELQQFLQGLSVGGVAEKRAFAFHVDETFGAQLVEMMREGRVGDFEFILNLANHQSFRMRRQQQLHDAEPGLRAHRGKHVGVGGDAPIGIGTRSW